MAVFGLSLWEQCLDVAAKAGAAGLALAASAILVDGIVELVDAHLEGKALEKAAKKAARAQKKDARAQRYAAASGHRARAHV